MKYEAPTRSTRSLSNFWNHTNPQISESHHAGPPLSLLQTTPIQSELTSSELPPKPASNPAVTASSWSAQSSARHPVKAEHCYKTHALTEGELIKSHTHTYITCFIVREIRRYASVTPYSLFTSFSLRFLCVAVVLFLSKAFIFFSTKASSSSCSVSSRSCESKVFPVTVLCIPG